MGGSDDGVGVQKSTTAEVGAALGQADDVGELAAGGRVTADDLLESRDLLGGRDGRSEGDGRHEKRGSEGEELHCGWWSC